MIKRICSGLVTLLYILLLAGCTQTDKVRTPTWQEQYDLGVRFLTEGNYEEAIIAFTAAIEIDPNQALAYVGRGDAYVGSGDAEENLAAAQADYEKAIEVDETLAAAYLGLADVLIRRGDYNKALEVLRNALEKVLENNRISNKIKEMEEGVFIDTSGRTRRSNHYENGDLIKYWLYEYNEYGNNIKTICYDSSDILKYTQISEYNEVGQEMRMTQTGTSDEPWTYIENYEYDTSGRKIRETSISTRGETEDKYYTLSLFSYDDDARTQTQDTYSDDDILNSRFVIEYDENGVRKKGSYYSADEQGNLSLSYYVEYIYNEDGTYGGYHLFEVATDNDSN